jgi:hypothetical protein
MHCYANAAARSRRFLRPAALLLATLVLAAGCTRAMMVGSDAGPLYRITVHNELAEAMIVSYNDGRGDAILGTVAARATDHFTIGRPARLDITVTARNAAGTRNLAPIAVNLSPETAQTVRLR